MSFSPSSRRAKPRWLLALGAVGAMSVLVAGVAFAAIAPGTLNTDDANLIVDADDGTGTDWAGVTEMRRSDLPSGSGDDSFTQGTKEDTAEPVVEFGSIPPNKSDLKDFGIYEEQIGGVNYVHLFWTRVQDPSGTTNMDFELNQRACTPGVSPADPDCAANGITPLRSVGDVLITYDLSRGGTRPVLGYREWNGTAWGPYQDLSGVNKATGSINTAAISAGDADGLGSLSPRTFGEASIDFDALVGSSECKAFGSAYLKSRSSDSFTSALKDFIAPQPINISNCGSITVVKDAVPNSGQDFTFTATGPSSFSSSFSLDDDGDGTLSNTEVINDLFAGTYYINETDIPSGWNLTGISCPDATVIYGRFSSGSFVNGGSNSFDAGDTTAAVTVQPDDEVTCTFTNTGRGTVVINKTAVGGNDTFPYATTGSGLSDFNLTTVDGTATRTFSNIIAGTKTVTEGTLPTGWDFTSLACTDPDDGTTVSGAQATIDLDPGETVTCTFTNTKRGTIVVDKITVPSGDTQSFSFDASGGTDPAYADFSLTHAADPNSQVLKPGSYSVAETVPDGWDLTSLSCTDASGGTTTILGTKTASIGLAAGETVTCTFTNTKRGKILVDKVTDPAGDPQSFAFTASYDGDGFSLTDAAAPNDSGYLVPGSYSVSESVPVGWQLSSATCSDGSLPSAIDLAAGETVTCTFNNTKLSTITVIKQTDPDGDPTSFAFTASYGSGGFSLSDGQSNDSGYVNPGTYSVSETVPAGWDLTSATCSDGSLPGAIGVSAGESVTCTFTNTKRGAITIEKEDDAGAVMAGVDFTLYVDLAPAGGAGPDAGDLEGTPAGSCTTDANGTCTISSLLPDVSYWVVEEDLDGYLEEDPYLALVEPGQTVTVERVNTRLFQIVTFVCKSADDTLYLSTADDSDDGSGATDTLAGVPAALAAKGVTAADLCSLAALFPEKVAGDHVIDVSIPVQPQ